MLFKNHFYYNDTRNGNFKELLRYLKNKCYPNETVTNTILKAS